MTRFLILLLFVGACSPRPQTDSAIGYDQSAALEQLAGNENERMRFQLIESRISDRSALWTDIDRQLAGFGAADYRRLNGIVFEQSIESIQASIREGQLTYPELVKWYLYRIKKYESDPARSLHTIIAINPNAVREAEAKQSAVREGGHPIYGIPILLKDNIGAAGMPTTAGAEILREHQPENAFIAERIEAQGGIILGKVNLSEWAYYFCSGCPLGYSAVGGQTLNPYGPRIFETGGSSAGSGTAVAANYAAAAVGTETAGSILSPSAQNSVVGLKPTIGLLSRSGIVPISYTLDTPGPMTRSVRDNAILLDAMRGQDIRDAKSVESSAGYTLKPVDWSEVRLGYLKAFLENDLYRQQIERLRSFGATLVELDPPAMNYDGFTTLLSGEMKRALPEYLDAYAPYLPQQTVAQIMEYNQRDTFHRAPYNQSIFREIARETISDADLIELQKELQSRAVNYLSGGFGAERIDALLSINNYSAAVAALAEHPAIAVPMGYQKTGEPMALTFIGKPWSERRLLQLAAAYETLNQVRRAPELYGR